MKNKLPQNWIEIPFGEIILTKKGKKPKKTITEPAVGYLPYILIHEMEGKGIRSYTNDEKVPVVNKEDVLLVWDGSIGKCASGLHGAIGSTLVAITPLGNIPTRLIEFFIKYKNQYIHQTSTGSGLQHINKNFFKDCLISLPALTEQQRIVAKLDGLFEHLDTLKIRLNNIPQILKNFRQAVLNQAVTGKLTEEWREGKELENYSDKQLCDLRKKEGEFENRSLDESGRRKQKIQPFSWNGLNNIGWAQVNVESAAIFIIDCLHSTPKFEIKGEYVVDTTCISPFKIHWKKARKINKEYFEKWVTRLAPRNGDILFSREGTIGIGVKVPKEKNICIGQRMMLFRFGSYIIPEFSEIYINSMVFKDEFRPHIKGVAAQHLNIGDIRKLNFPIPSIREQTEIVKRVENLFAKADAIQAAYDKLKQQIDALPQAILAKAFKGELVAQLETDGDAKDLLKEIAAMRASVEKVKKTKKKQKVNI
jgi:type I restriction enzyme S subunit